MSEKLDAKMEALKELSNMLGTLRENAIFEKGKMAGYVQAIDKIKEIVGVQQNNLSLMQQQEEYMFYSEAQGEPEVMEGAAQEADDNAEEFEEPVKQKRRTKKK